MSSKQKRVEDSVQIEFVKWVKKEFQELAKVDVRCNKLDGLRGIIEISREKKMGQAIAGTPDLTIYLIESNLTYIIEVELKRKDGHLNKNQKDWWFNFKENFNHKGFVGYGLLDAQKKFREKVLLIKKENKNENIKK